MIDYRHELLDYLREYNGKDAQLKGFSRLVREDPDWMPSPLQARTITDHIAHLEDMKYVLMSSAGRGPRPRGVSRDGKRGAFGYRRGRAH